MSKHIIVKPKEYQKALLVDQVDIDGKNRLLPGEISESVDDFEKSAEVIVPRVNEWFYAVKMNRLNVCS